MFSFFILQMFYKYFFLCYFLFGLICSCNNNNDNNTYYSSVNIVIIIIITLQVTYFWCSCTSQATAIELNENANGLLFPGIGYLLVWTSWAVGASRANLNLRLVHH